MNSQAANFLPPQSGFVTALWNQAAQGAAKRMSLPLQQGFEDRDGLVLQPEAKPISSAALKTELDSVYSALNSVEKACVEYVKSKKAHHIAASSHSVLLHLRLLDEYYDYLVVAQHPQASPELHQHLVTHCILGRMWKCGIYPFLDLLTMQLPQSLELMLMFLHKAYAMVTVMYETVPAFNDTWTELLGDLGRYCMSCLHKDKIISNIWKEVSRSWYLKAADRNPGVGRLYHHLAIVAQPDTLQQLYYYARSFTTIVPFPPAIESITKLFDSIGKREGPATEVDFIRCHAYLFSWNQLSDKRGAKSHLLSYNKDVQLFLRSLDKHIRCVTSTWKIPGIYIAVINLAGWFGFGLDWNVLRQVFLPHTLARKKIASKDEQPPQNDDQSCFDRPEITDSEVLFKLQALSKDTSFIQARYLTVQTFELVLLRRGDAKVLPHIHVVLSFLAILASEPRVSDLIKDIPWDSLVLFLNNLIKTETRKSKDFNLEAVISQPLFPGDHDNKERDEIPLPEDYLLRGQAWMREYFPKDWFGQEHDEPERYLDRESTMDNRTKRVLRLGLRLSKDSSSTCRWISFDSDKRTFAAVNTKALHSSSPHLQPRKRTVEKRRT